MKDVWIYDFETFRNFTSVVFYNVYTYKVEKAYAYGADTNLQEVKSLLAKFNKPGTILVGYNNQLFDDIIYGYILYSKDWTPANVYETAQEIINHSNKRTIWDSAIFKYRPKVRFVSIDLLQLFNPIDRVSLKKLGISMKAPRLQDLPLKHDELVPEDMVEPMMDYNFNDCYTTRMAYVALYEEIALRFQIRKQYGIKNVLSSCRSKLSKQLMATMYEEHTGIPYDRFKDLRTEYDSINVRDCLSDKVKFQTKNMQEFHEKLKFMTISGTKAKFKETVLIGNTKYDVGLGGLHSQNEPRRYVTDSQFIIWDHDFGSWYPNLMLNLGIFPKHLGEQFLDLFRIIVTQRLQAKADHNMTIANTLKIVINAVFGLMKYSKSWFYDPQALYSVTLNGQLFLLMIIEDFELNGIPVIYANTDGWMVHCPKDKEPLMHQLIVKWQTYFDIPLESEKIEQALIRDVNNFTLMKSDGKFKQKGDLIIEPQLGKSYDAPIIAFAIHEWFYNNVPLETTIAECDDIHMFVMTQNVDAKKYEVEYHTLGEHSIEITKLQKINRYIAAKGMDSGVLYKRKLENDRLANMLKSSQVYLMNDIDYKKPFETYPVNLQYYISRAKKFQQLFTHQQTKLFG